jgi:hypothetical protein
MAHFAEIFNGIVQRVIVVNNAELLENGEESEAKGIKFCENLFGGEWIQTSYSGSIRARFAGIGYEYRKDADVFIAPQPFKSWKLNSSYEWQAPKPYPKDEHSYNWDENSQEWIKIDES